jgi:hypothetical protein
VEESHPVEVGIIGRGVGHNIQRICHLLFTSLPNEVVQVRRTGKGCLSYVVGSDGEAMVVDASLDPEVYLRLAEGRGWRVTRVRGRTRRPGRSPRRPWHFRISILCFASTLSSWAIF